ncbi:hypothetical protein SAMN05216456_2288 [Devosia crocina]|uniref:Uncharacterized protein n=1 Tax=Devosia crocina TaxID=429728 RepID=A0A1I7NMT0_9HYPH|nr:hypothetical protein [Devosia crocina]SFV35957.1 hypothetical protein SAMN05216456_2288 [Devosia crocina]
MMFLMRSAFWLTAAFLVIKPEADIRDSAEAVANQALASGSQFISEQIEAIECDSLHCFGGKAVVAAALPAIPPAEPTAAAVAAEQGVPLPRPRPDRAG